MYGIRAGSKTQDVFKAFLGAAPLAGGALLAGNKDAGTNYENLEHAVLYGAGSYVAIALLLTWAFSSNLPGGQGAVPAPGTAQGNAKGTAQGPAPAPADNAQAQAPANNANKPNEGGGGVGANGQPGQQDQQQSPAAARSSKISMWVYLLGRILLGEDFKANGQR